MEVLPSPKFHKAPELPTLVFEKFTVNGAWQDEVGLPVNAATGFGTIVIGFIIESLQPAKLLTNFTWYVPSAVNDLTGLITVDVVPSLNRQITLSGVGWEVFTKDIGELMQPVAGAVKFACATPTLIILSLVSVSRQPVVLVTIN